MSDLETRLNVAAAETRHAGRQMTPPALLTRRQPRARGWLVLATAFAAVLLVFAVPALLGPDYGAPLGQQPEPTLSSPSTTEVEPTTTGPEDPVACSSNGVPQPELDPDLPAEVSAKAQAISGFAATCDLDGLASLAAPRFTTSFGGGGFDNLARWEAEGRGELGTLLRVLGTSHAVMEREDGPDIYAWPAAFAYDHWEDIPEEYIEELLTIHTEEELDQIAGFGSYAGWRIGIDEEGNWLYFVAGD